jgi:CRISPR/Cas system-associated exonuclease Cas4 (RecB family)
MKTEESNAYLSKSLFIRGLQCHKSLYLQKNQPDLKDEISAGTEARFRMGHEVGRLAQGLFPGGIEIPYEGLSHGEQISKTASAVDEKQPVIYEATFSHDGIFVKADILRHVRGGWELYEVKSAADMKEVYYSDVAIQYYVLTGAGLNVRKAFVVYINSKYVRQGEIDVRSLFCIEDITDEVVERQGSIPKELKTMRRMLAGDVPGIDIGRHCKDPYDCDFMGSCWAHIPQPSVFNLRERGVDAFELYGRGIVRLEDIPLDELNSKQRMQVEAYLTRKDHILVEKVREFLDGLEYPLSVLDFETIYPPVPPYDGTRPYQQVPFQFSLHRIAAPGRQLEHFEYLGMPGEDPREPIAEKLIELIPEKGSILAYNAPFEIRILKELATRFPRYSKKLNAMIKRFRDPMLLFKSRHVYLWPVQGAYSIKVVLPTLVPELRYDDEEIQDGGMASEAWFRMAESRDPEEIARIRASLLSYCRLDTYGVVRILEKLKAYAGR